MARNTRSPAKMKLPRISVSRTDAKQRLGSRLELGSSLASRNLSNAASLTEAEEEYRRWDDFNVELIRRLFTTPEYSEAYSSAGQIPMFVIGGDDPSHQSNVEDFHYRIKAKIDYLSSLIERLDLIDETEVSVKAAAAAPLPRKFATRKVFVVHGRDREAEAIVTMFLRKCDLEPIVLHDEPDQGQTLIEKFEASSDVPFAIILLTPDDVGGLKPASPEEKPNLSSRARQNVILELGFFVGKLGRKNVLALKRGELELPSDFAGVVYTPLGYDEGWKLKLAKELNAAGLSVDLNRALI